MVYWHNNGILATGYTCQLVNMPPTHLPCPNAKNDVLSRSEMYLKAGTVELNQPYVGRHENI